MSDKSKMEVSEEQVEYIAGLARLELSVEEIKRLSRELGEIIQYINMLNELDTTNVKPTYSSMEGNCRVRDDIVQKSMPRSGLLNESPQHDNESVLVPVVITGS
jgi:aspartyl-tRNA(Asn)/glutamyl-tRNA(Gln) amidotransferase subunit C